MKRVLFIATPLLVALALLVTMAAAVSSFPLAAQNELDNTIHFLNSSLGQDKSALYEVQTMVRASRPWNLRPELNYLTLGDSLVFHTDLRYSSPTPQLQTPVWNQYFDHNSDSTLVNGRPSLPFPPQDVWCILLSDGTRDQLLLLALHNQEPYKTDWIVHQGPSGSFDQTFLSILSDMGCDLSLEP